MVDGKYYPRILKAPKESFFLFGLRGVGKSTWARERFPDAVRFDLLESYVQLYLREEIQAEERGALLEGWVAGLLRARLAYGGRCDEISYWAPAQGGTEVDFPLRRGREFTAIEVKSTPTPGPGDFTGLRAIADLPGVRRRILVHLGSVLLPRRRGSRCCWRNCSRGSWRMGRSDPGDDPPCANESVSKFVWQEEGVLLRGEGVSV